MPPSTKITVDPRSTWMGKRSKPPTGGSSGNTNVYHQMASTPVASPTYDIGRSSIDAYSYSSFERSTTVLKGYR
jgi:hypothetical protein